MSVGGGDGDLLHGVRWRDEFCEGVCEQRFGGFVVVVERMTEEGLRKGVDRVGLEVVAYPF